MTEAELLTAVTTGTARHPGLCALLGVWWYHTHDSRRSTSGWPDLVLVARKVLFRELKTDTGGLSPEQRRVGYKLTAAGCDFEVWRPKDLASGRITRELQEIL